jgi:hypothetical protein
MAVGTTANFVMTRNDVVAAALRKVRAWPEDGNPPLGRVRDAIKALNRLLRHEDNKGVTVNKNLWAISHDAILLAAGSYIYGTSQGLPSNVLDLFSAHFRNTSGDDSEELDIITTEEYARLPDKDETGDPSKVYLKRDRLLADQKLYIWPGYSVTNTSLGTSSVVTGTDALDYTCIKAHESLAINRPITGASYSLYWKQTGTGGSAWATATDYTNQKLLWMAYKRPLFDFDGPYDNPDMPLGWENYLIYKLAVDLAPEFGLPLDDRRELKNDLKMYENELFPSSRGNANTYHNKAVYF